MEKLSPLEDSYDFRLTLTEISFFFRTNLTDYSVVSGEFDITKTDGTEKIFGVTNIIMHDYNTSTAENDIAILYIDKMMVMDFNRQPACLPVPQDDFRPITDRKSDVDVCLVLGWGKGLGSGTLKHFLFPDS